MSRKFNVTIAPKNNTAAKRPAPRVSTMMELAFGRAAQKKRRTPANSQEKRK